MFFPQNQVKTNKKKKIPAENWSVFSPKSGEDQKIYDQKFMTKNLWPKKTKLKGCMSGHFSSVQNTEKEEVWVLFQIIFHQKGGRVLQKENVW